MTCGNKYGSFDICQLMKAIRVGYFCIHVCYGTSDKQWNLNMQGNMGQNRVKGKKGTMRYSETIQETFENIM